MKVSILVPCRNEIEFIDGFIQSIKKQDYTAEDLELIIIDGMSSDGTYEYLKARKDQDYKILINPKKIVSTALNLGLFHATGDIILRLDVHCVYPKNYISSLVAFHKKNDNVGSVGGRSITQSPVDTKIGKLIALAGSTPFGVGNSHFRVTHNLNPMEVDTVPLGCWKKEIFEEVGLFDPELIRNQDDEFHQRLIKNNYKVIMLPHIRLIYFSRKSIMQNMNMYYQYGLYKPLVCKKIGKITTLRQLMPSLFLIVIVALFLIIPFEVTLGLFSYSIILLFYFFGAYYSLKREKMAISAPNILTLILILSTMHAAYGYGYLRGLFGNLPTPEITR